MGLIEDFATWTEKARRSLLRESGERGRVIHDRIPPGVPVSVSEAVRFIDSLLALDPPGGIARRAEKWREKLCRTPNCKPGRNFQG